MKAKEFDQKFDEGEDMSEFFDLSQARRPNRDKQKLEISLPLWIIQKLETEAKQQGISTQTFLENYLAQHLAHS